MENDLTILIAIASAIGSSLVTALIAWRQTKSHAEALIASLRENLQRTNKQLEEGDSKQKSLDKDLKAARAQIGILTAKAKKLESVRAKLRDSRVVKTYSQPVILLGPRGVGKTSLLMQWYAPWVPGDLTLTRKHFIAEVPVHDFDKSEVEPHFADPEVKVPVDVHLGLRVHDFPGELEAQPLVRQIIAQETLAVREETDKNIGVVLVCMFDVSQAKSGTIGRDTQEYYNSDLFRELKTLASGPVFLQRIILAFNKYDLLKPHFNGASESKILEHCAQCFGPLLMPLRGACNPEKFCEVFTIVPREDMQFRNQGAVIVKAEASRTFVEMFVGKKVAEELLPQRASSIVAGRLGF